MTKTELAILEVIKAGRRLYCDGGWYFEYGWEPPGAAVQRLFDKGMIVFGTGKDQAGRYAEITAAGRAALEGSDEAE